MNNYILQGWFQTDVSNLYSNSKWLFSSGIFMPLLIIVIISCTTRCKKLADTASALQEQNNFIYFYVV